MTWLQFWLWVASFLISDFFRERLPSQTAAGVGDFNIPTATEGRSVPVIIGGTMRVDAPNCIWYGQFLADPKTVTTGVIFKDEETVGYRYRLALQYALGKFVAKGMTGIWIGDEKVWDYVADAGGVPQTVVDVTKYDLFGGNDSGGGFSGRFRLHTGEANQAESAYLRDIVGLSPLPAYRGLCYVMITNTTETSFEGFRIVESTPETLGAYIGDQNQLRYIRIEVQTFDAVAGTGLGDRLGLGNDHHFIGRDANPIAVAYELYLNDSWGRAFPLSDVDTASFQAAAETCWTEGIGYSQIIDEQTSTSDIQDTLEQHVDGYIGPNPITGRIEVTLSRPDYVLATEFQATDDNIIKVEKWNKGDWSQTYNRVRIRYVDRDKDWNETHAIQTSPANRIIQGRTVTKELRYQGCHDARVAAVLAARGNRTLSLPQSSGTIVLDRTAWQIRPGSVMSLTSVQANETELAVRVTKIELGDGIGNSMKAEVVADLSGNEVTTVADSPPTDFVPPVQAVIPFDAADQAAFETPFLLMRADASPNSVPRITTIARRAGANYPTEYEVVRRTASGTPAGAYTSTDFVTNGFCIVGALRNDESAGQSGNGALSLQVDGIAGESLDGLIDVYSPALGNFAGVAIVSPGLDDEEWLFFDEIVDDGAGVRLENVWRSAMDTTWKAHAAGARVWFIWTGGMGMGPEVYTQAWNVELKLLPSSPNASVLEAAATALPIVTIDTATATRNSKPLVPSTITLNGTEFGTDVDFDILNTQTTPAAYNGLQVVPTHRLWRVQDIGWSVRGLDVAGGGLDPAELTAENMRISAWLHNLDAFPSAPRAQALLTITDQLAPLTGNDDVYALHFDRADLLALEENDGEPRVQGEGFAARLEIETKHSPAGQVANNVSHEPLLHDFSATGQFPARYDDPHYRATFNGADADTTARDLTEHNLPVAFIGNAAIDTSQSVFGGSSIEFDGTGDALAICYRKPYTSLPWGPGASDDDDFTVDFRIRFRTVGVAQMAIFGKTAAPPFRGWYFRLNAAGTQVNFGYSSNGTAGFSTAIGFNWSPVVDTWYACRLIRDRANYAFYVDGTRIGTAILFTGMNTPPCDLTLGGVDEDGVITDPLDGWLEDFRVIQGRFLHLTSVTSYTVDAEELSSYGGHLLPLLVHADGTDTDTTYPEESPNRFTLTADNTSEIDTAQFKFGSASLRCDGVNTSTTVSDGWIVSETVGARHPAFDFKRGDFFMDLHVRFNALPATNSDGMALIAKYARTIGDGADWSWSLNNNTTMAFVHYNSGQIASIGGNTGNVAHGLTLSTGVWYHFAIERVGNALYMYADGDRIYANATYFDAVPYVLNGRQSGATYYARPVTIGRYYSVGSVSRMRAFNGWIDEVRIEKRAVLNGAATYAIPSAAGAVIEADDEAVRLLWDCESIVTNDRRQTSALLSGTSIATARQKFGTSSLRFNGSGTNTCRLTPSRAWWGFEDGPFTVDVWHNLDVAPTLGGIAFASQWIESGNRRGWRFAWNETDDALEFEWTTDGSTIKRAFAALARPTLDTWVHFQVVRDGSTLYLFADGVLLTLDGASDSIGTDVIFESNAPVYLGSQDIAGYTGQVQGNYDEFRITKTAENTTSFTPETAPYPRPTLPNY